MSAVAPLRKIAHVRLGLVARSGDKPALACGDGIKRCHAQAGCDVRQGGVRELCRSAERLNFGFTDRREIDRAGLDAVVVGDGLAVNGIQLIIAL